MSPVSERLAIILKIVFVLTLSLSSEGGEREPLDTLENDKTDNPTLIMFLIRFLYKIRELMGTHNH